MSTEAVERRKSLYGFITSENRYAADLERVLGISFPHKPARIDLGPWNTVMAAAHSVDGLDGLKLALLRISLFGGKREGAYVPEYHAYFCRKDAPLIERHENMHAYIRTVNPDLHGSVKKALDSDRGIILYNSQAPSQIELATARLAIDEGLAHWGSVQVGLESDDASQRAVAVRQHNGLMLNQPDLTKATRFGDYAASKLQDSTQRVRSVVAEYDAYKKSARNRGVPQNQQVRNFAQLAEGKRRFGAIQTNRMILKNNINFFGYLFTYSFMEEAEKQRMPIPTALNTLIANPPSHLGAFGNPLRYFRDIFRKR